MHGLVRYKLERRCWRACGEDVSFTDVKKKKSQREDVTRNVNDVLHRKRARRILEDLKKSELRTRLRTGRVDFRGSLRLDEFVRYGRRTWWGVGIWKSHHRKIVHLSSLCRNLWLKCDKRIRTWTKKSLRVFRVSGFLCSMYICYENFMYVSHIHVWVCYIHWNCNKLVPMY